MNKYLFIKTMNRQIFRKTYGIISISLAHSRNDASIITLSQNDNRVILSIVVLRANQNNNNAQFHLIAYSLYFRA